LSISINTKAICKQQAHGKQHFSPRDLLS